MNWVRSSSCSSGSCVEVQFAMTWQRSSRCDSSSCVEVQFVPARDEGLTGSTVDREGKKRAEGDGMDPLVTLPAPARELAKIAPPHLRKALEDLPAKRKKTTSDFNSAI